MSTESASTRPTGGLARTRGLEARIADLAYSQHGVVSRRQLVELGLGEDGIDGRLGRGLLHRVHRSVYSVGHRVPTSKGRWMAAVLTGPDGAVLSHRSAAALWGIQRYEGQGVDVSLTRRSRSSAAIRRHVVALPADEVVRVDGIPVTTVSRTILDLAAVSRPEVVESALREAEYLRLDDRLSLSDLVDRYPGRRGLRTVRSVLDRREEAPGRTRSPLEARFLACLDAHNLPRPQLNVWLRVGERDVEVDCLWPADRQVVELDGWAAHGTMAAFHEDRARDRSFCRAGYGITRLTWAQLNDEPDVIARDLRTLLRRTSYSPASAADRGKRP